MSEYVPTTDEVRDVLVYLNTYHAKQYGDVDLLVVGSETAAQFDRWLAKRDAEVAAKAYERAILDVGLNPDLANQFLDTNPYRKVVQS